MTGDLAADMACLASDVAQLLRMHAQAKAQIDRLSSHVQNIQQQLQAQALDAQVGLQSRQFGQIPVVHALFLTALQLILDLFTVMAALCVIAKFFQDRKIVATAPH